MGNNKNLKIVNILIINLLYINISFSQSKGHVIESEILQAIQNGAVFENFQLFHVEQPIHNVDFLQLGASELSLLQLDKGSLLQLMDQKPGYLSFEIADPVYGQIKILLKRQYLEGPESRIQTPDNPVGSPMTEGLFYRGTIANISGSFAAVSFFSHDIIGVISSPEQGNAVLGKLEQQTETETEVQYAFYYERSLFKQSDFHCGASEVKLIKDQLSQLAPETIFPNRCKTTTIYLECDYKLYTDHNRSVSQTENFIRGLFNVVKALYYRDSINLEISNIFVWTSQDPYLHTDLQSILVHYSSQRRDNFAGNLAQLVTTFAPQQQGGIAWLGTLCQPFNGISGPHSFAFINRNYSQLPTYSWSVMVMAHELGHNLGSPHTHACNWGPSRNAALDNCYQTEGGCMPGPRPSNGGTVMSYCHLAQGVGINFSNGFGAEPGALIRNRISQASCVMPSFTATLVNAAPAPYMEGDKITLKARPYNSNYTYDWFHYDYRLPTARDTQLNVNYSGIFRAAVSDRCTEYTQSDTIEISDFLVNLGCPKIPGKRDSFVVELIMNADQTLMRDSLLFPDSIYQKIPTQAKDILVELQHTIEPKGTSWTRDVQFTYQSPSSIGISNARYTPSSGELPLNKEVKTYRRILGNFNPRGKWYFTTQDIRFDAGIDAMITIKVVLSWRMKDSIISCEIPICGNDSLKLDAGIAGATYVWSNGAKSKTITTNKEGPISVQVTKNNKTARHQVNLTRVPVKFNQGFMICDGDSILVGTNVYKSDGTFVDTLMRSNGCDSIVNTKIEILKKAYSFDTVSLCYADTFEFEQRLNDTTVQYLLQAINGCDSIHRRFLKVNPQINYTSNVEPACENLGGKIYLIPSGGKDSLFITWANGDTSRQLEKLNSGTYSFTIKDRNNCHLDGAISLQNFDSIKIKDQVVEILCFGDNNGEIFIDVTSGKAPFNFNWSSGKSTANIGQLAAGKYTLFIRDDNGCQYNKNFELINPDPLIVILDSQPSSGLDGTASANVFGGKPPYNYSWSTGANTSSISMLAPGIYSVTVTDINNCETIQTISVQVKVAVGDIPEEQFVIVYPNPVLNDLFLELKAGHQFTNGYICNIINQQVMEIGKLQDLELVHFSMHNFNAGVYWIALKRADGSMYRYPIIKE